MAEFARIPKNSEYYFENLVSMPLMLKFLQKFRGISKLFDSGVLVIWLDPFGAA